MMKDLHWLIILFILGLLIFYSNKNNNSIIPLKEGYRNSIVHIGGPPITSKHLINSNEIPFGLLSGYEVGKVNTNGSNNSNINYSGYYRSNEYY
jgi:hypothetical protein